MAILQHVRVFVSSPGDVDEERKLTRAVVKDKLPVFPFLRDRVTFDLVSWDDPDARTPTPAHLPHKRRSIGALRNHQNATS